MEEYIKAGFILRENKRYTLNLPFLESTDRVELDQRGLCSRGQCSLSKLKPRSSKRNSATRPMRDSHRGDGLLHDIQTLPITFIKVAHQYPLTEDQEK